MPKAEPTLLDGRAEAWRQYRYARAKCRRSKTEQAKRQWSLQAMRALSLFLRYDKAVQLKDLQKRLDKLEEGATRSEQPGTQGSPA